MAQTIDMTWASVRRVLVAAVLLAAAGPTATVALAQSFDPITPVLTVLAPAPDAVTHTGSATIDATGTIDHVAPITEVTWSNDRGGHGTADGTSTWAVTAIPLQPGSNELTFTARDAAGNTASARVTVRSAAAAPAARSAGAAPAPTLTTVTTTLDAPRATSAATPVGLAAPNVATPQSTVGLVAAYGFDEASGNTVNDASGNGHRGTLSGGVTRTTQGRFGRALDFNGAAFVTVPDDAGLDLGSAMTLEAWLYPTAAPTRTTTAIMKEQADGLAYALYAGSATGRPRTAIELDSDPGTAHAVNAPVMLPLHTWTHLAATFDGTSLRLYLNGVLAASRDVPGALAESTGPLRIGGNGVWGEYFRGRIDEVRIYNRALSQAEVRANMVTPIGAQAPAIAGQWAGPFTAPLVAIHGTLLRTGEVLVWDNSADSVHTFRPSTHTFHPVEDSQTNVFCAGHCALPDGRILVAGGHIAAHIGLPDANIFDPETLAWTVLNPMARSRWYPTVTTLPDGRMLVMAGEDGCFGCYVELPEIYDPATDTWTSLTNATLSLPFYPHMFVLPDGRVLAASTTEDTIVTRVLDVGAQTWSVVDPLAVDGGSAVMYRPGKIMKSGINFDADVPVVPSTATTYVLDMTQPSPLWRETASMIFPRAYHNLTLLPDGQVLVTGGGDTTDAVGVDGAIAAAELWSPVTETWAVLAAMQRPRLYHSIALLLPDARVLVGGGGRFSGPVADTDQLSVEIFSPPYLFKGARPVISSAPATTTYGATMAVHTAQAASIASVALVKPGSVTHSFNADQRYVPLSFAVSGGTLQVHAPANANLAPPGYYMLFIVDTKGVPSVARFVRVGP